jgi:signal transduction histidine kinase
MATALASRSEPDRLFRLMSLRQLQWATIIFPLAFVVAHHFLMVGPMHPFFHNWYGFASLLIPLAILVWAFSGGVFGIFRKMQSEIEELNEEKEALVVERERQQIAREMHDGLAQVLSFVNTKAQAVELFLEQDDADSARRHIAELSEAARDVYADVREGIVALQAQGGEGRTLRDVLDEYVEQFRNFAHLDVEIEWDANLDVPALTPAVEVQLIRIVQEALTNVRRHGHASSARVVFTSEADDLTISVRDDGQGFDPSSIARGDWPKFGLRAMRERAESVGGELDIESAIGAGTTVSARFPGVLATAAPA